MLVWGLFELGLCVAYVRNRHGRGRTRRPYISILGRRGGRRGGVVRIITARRDLGGACAHAAP